MIKLIFNRFADDGATQDINVDIKVNADASSAKKAANDIESIADSTEKPISKMDALKNKFSQLPSAIKELKKTTSDTFKAMSDGLNKTNDSLSILEKGFKSLSIVRLSYLFRTVKRGVSMMVDTVENAANYEEALNLYRMALGKFVDKATAWSDRITDKLKLDPADVMKYTGALYNLTKGLGVSADAAYIMGTNLTQLTYDMASYLNISNEAAFAKIQSAMAGQSRAVATVGVATQMASLQELAYSLGIKKKVKDMTQAEKTYLRYIQLMRQTSQMQGDLGRTMITPANAIRTLKNQINLLARSIGQVLTPIIMKAIPYIMALTNVLTKAATAIAEFFGYKVAEVDYSSSFSFEGAEEGAENLNNLGNAASAAGKKVSNSLAPFDELNQVLNENAGAGGGGGAGGDTSFDSGVWDKLLPQYDMLKDYTDQLVSKAKELEDEIGRIAKVIAGIAVVSTLGSWIIKMNELKNALDGLGPAATTAFKLIAGAALMYIGDTVFDSLVDDALHAESEIMSIGERIKLAIGTLLMTIGGALIGSIAGPVGTVVGALVGLSAAFADLSIKGSAAIEIAEMGYTRLEKNTNALSDYSKKLKNTMQPLDDNINASKKLYDNYRNMTDRLDKIIDKNGKVKEGYEAEAKTIVNQLNSGLGTHIKLQDGEIKNYQKVRDEINKTLKVKEREATLNAYYEKYKVTLTELDDAQKNYSKSYINARDAENQAAEASDKMNILNYKSMQRVVDKAKEAEDIYISNRDTYYNMLADKAKYEALFTATSEKNWDKVDSIIEGSAYTQEYWVRQSLVKMTNEVDGPLSESLIQSWMDLAGKSSGEYNKGLNEIGNEDTKKQIYQAMEKIYNGEKTHASNAGNTTASSFVTSSQQTLNRNPLSPTYSMGTTNTFKTNSFSSINSYFGSNSIGVKFNSGNAGSQLKTDIQKYFEGHPIKLSGSVQYIEKEGSSGGLMSVKLNENGGYVKSGDLFFANENGRSEFITHVGGHDAVVNQDQMIQAVSSAIMAGFSMFNGGSSGNTTVYIGNDKIYEGQGRYQSRQTDRYGTSVINL